jgi:hypothetical protein
MRPWFRFGTVGAVGIVIAVAVTLVVGHALQNCTVPAGWLCHDGLVGCLRTNCSLWSPAFLIGPASGAVAAVVTGFAVHRATAPSN